jgi:predicted small lipoprotein YifL
LCRPIKEPDVSEFRRLSRGLAVIAVLAVAFGLAACGRKGDLDLPPSASATGQPQTPANSGLLGPVAVTPIGGQTSGGNSGVGPNGEPVAPKGPKKYIPLDVLLN